MGEMADFALDNAFEEMAHYERNKDKPIDKQYEEGLVDENGVTIGNPNSYPAVPPKK